MKVLDIITEGKFSWLGTAGERLIAKEVVDAMAARWADAIISFKQANGKMPTFNEIMIKYPPDKMTTEKALANNPEIQKEAWEQALKEVNKKFTGKGLEAIDQLISKVGLKIAGLGGWLAWFAKWGARLAMVYELDSAWVTYEKQLKLALEDLNSGDINGEQFKTLHDRILIQFYAAATPVIFAAGVGGFFRVGMKSAEIYRSFKHGRFIRDIIAVNPGDKLFSNFAKTLAPAGVVALAEFLNTDWARTHMVYYLTAEGMKEGNVRLDPTFSGTTIEKIVADSEKFKREALAAAKRGNAEEKIPPSVRPKAAEPDNKPAAPASSSAAAPADNDQDEAEPPVSGGLPQRPQQGAQPAGTSSEWK